MDKTKIMVLDDNRLMLQITKDVLEEAGYEVITRDNPIGTTVAIKSEKPHCLLLDFFMPGLNGGEVVDFLKANSDHNLKIIFYSNQDDKELERLTNEKGAHGYIKKSTDLHKLVDMLKMILHN